MDNTGVFIVTVYSIASCGFVLVLAYLNFRPQIKELSELLRILALRYLSYPRVFSHRQFGYWSRADVITQATYLGVNVLCICYKASSISSTGLRAANLALIHIAVLCCTLSFRFVTNLLGLKWATTRYLHMSVGAMVLVLLTWHTLTIAISGTPVAYSKPEDMWGLLFVLLGKPPTRPIRGH